MAGFYDWLHNALGSGVNGETTERLQPGPAPASPAQSALLGSYWPSEAPAQPMAAPASPPAALPTFMQGQTPFAGPTPIPHPPGFVGETSPQPAVQMPARAPMPPARPAEAGPPMPITPQAAPAAPEVSPWRKFSDMLSSNSDQLLYMGAGLLSSNNFGEGLMRGLQGASLAKATAAKADLDRAKAAREATGLTARAQWLAQRHNIPIQQAIGLAMNEGGFSKLMGDAYAPADRKFGVIGKDEYGNEKYGFVDPKTGQVVPAPAVGSPASPAAPGQPGVGAPPPGVDPKVWREKQTEALVAANAPPRYGDIAEMRKEIHSNPAVKRYSEATPAYNTMVRAAKIDTAAGDLAFVYGLAKVFDPDSVVREGEMQFSTNAQSIPDRVLGTIRAVTEGKTRLSPQVKEELIGIVNERMQEARQQYDDYIAGFDPVLKRYGIARDLVAPRMRDMLPVPAIRAVRPPDGAQVRQWTPGGGVR